MNDLERKKKIKLYNIIYFAGVFCVVFLLALIVYNYYIDKANWKALQALIKASPEKWKIYAEEVGTDFGTPKMSYYTWYIIDALAVGTVPMIVSSIVFYRKNNFHLKEKYVFMRLNLILLPAFICFIILCFRIIWPFVIRALQDM